MYDEFHKLDCEVIAISVDSHYTHLAWQHTPRDVSYILGNILIFQDYLKFSARWCWKT